MDSNGINLLRTQSVLSQEELAFLERFRVISGMIIAVVLGIGIFVGGAYLAAKFQYDRLEERRVTLARSITAQAKKQILLLSLQDRIPIIQKTIEAQYPWDTVVENLVSVVRLGNEVQVKSRDIALSVQLAPPKVVFVELK